MTLAVVVLAAGASRRLGEPKALARIGDRTALQHLALAARTLTGGPRTLVVTGAHHEEIAAHVEASALDVDVAHNPDWAQGRTGSVAVGAAARPGMDLVVAPIDAPLVPGEVFEALEREWKARGAPLAGWLAPATDGGSRYGHPVVLGRELARSAAASPISRRYGRMLVSASKVSITAKNRAPIGMSSPASTNGYPSPSQRSW